MPQGIVWTAGKRRRLAELVAAGLSYAAIAEALEVSKNAVAGQIYRQGLAKPAGPEVALAILEKRLGWPQVMMAGCRWVVGDPRGMWQWCGAPLAQGSWCAAHRARAYGGFATQADRGNDLARHEPAEGREWPEL